MFMPTSLNASLCLQVHHNLMRSLALEYFGWELATEGDAFLLAFHDVYDAVSFALTFQTELMDQEWSADLLEDVDAKVRTPKQTPNNTQQHCWQHPNNTVGNTPTTLLATPQQHAPRTHTHARQRLLSMSQCTIGVRHKE
jgi:hypothetical protein